MLGAFYLYQKFWLLDGFSKVFLTTVGRDNFLLSFANIIGILLVSPPERGTQGWSQSWEPGARCGTGKLFFGQVKM